MVPDAAGVAGLLGRDVRQWPLGSWGVVPGFPAKKTVDQWGWRAILLAIYDYFGGNTHKSINPKLTLRACARVVTSLSGSRGQVLMRHKIFVANAVHDWTSAHDEWLQKQAGAPRMFLVSGFWQVKNNLFHVSDGGPHGYIMDIFSEVLRDFWWKDRTDCSDGSQELFSESDIKLLQWWGERSLSRSCSWSHGSTLGRY